MEFEYFREPMEELEEPGSELEDLIEVCELSIFEWDPEITQDLAESYEDDLFDKYLQEEKERQEQEEINALYQVRIP